MMSRKSLWLCLILALVAAGLSLQPAAKAQKQKQQKYTASSGPPTLALNVEPNTVKACEGGAQVQLTANAKSPDGAPLRYRWQVTGGQVKGEGANPSWDLTGLQPGVYRASIEVDDGGDINCVAFSSIPIVVLDC